MTEIIEIFAREILDSRGNPTVEVDVVLADGVEGRASVPSGASTGKYESVEVRDKDLKRYSGKGVQKAINGIREVISPEICGIDVFEQDMIDRMMCHIDETENKAMVGANAILGVSLAVAQAAASSLEMPLYRYLGGVQACVLPVPLCSAINGGFRVDNELVVQELSLAPVGFDSFSEAIRGTSEVFHALKLVLREKGYYTATADEGGYAPQISTIKEGFDLVLKAVEEVGYTPGQHFYLGVDCAASEFYNAKEKVYDLKGEKLKVGSDELASFYNKLIKNYPVIGIEDPFDQDDWEAWTKFSKAQSDIHVMGDDLFATDVRRIESGISKKAADTVVIKPNQIGTLTEALHASRVAQRHGMTTVMAHRSGETEDTFIADLCVATQSKLFKAGGLSHSERIAKYNQLLRIEEALGEEAAYVGKLAIRGKSV